MPSFMVRLTYDVRVQDKFETTIEGLQDKYEIGSRCFEDYIEQTAQWWSQSHNAASLRKVRQTFL